VCEVFWVDCSENKDNALLISCFTSCELCVVARADRVDLQLVSLFIACLIAIVCLWMFFWSSSRILFFVCILRFGHFADYDIASCRFYWGCVCVYFSVVHDCLGSSARSSLSPSRNTTSGLIAHILDFNVTHAFVLCIALLLPCWHDSWKKSHCFFLKNIDS